MNINDFRTEEKVRLDPKCWTGKKIGNPKTKVKGGVRVNNCVPAESVAEGGYPEVDHMPGKRGIGLDSAKSKDTYVATFHASKEKEAQEFAKKNGHIVKKHVYPKSANNSQPHEFQVHKNEQGVAEQFNPEYDDEAGMAQGSLHTLQNAVAGLQDVIDSGDNLPEWCQEKISLAEDYLVTVWDYIQSEKAQGIDPEIEEMYEAMEELAEEMAHRNRVSVDRVWESFEALPDNVLYETAAWRRKEGKSKSGGLNAKGVASYRRENPGSKLQTAVTTKPSKLKPGSKAAKRRKSFCARMSGVKGPMKKPNGKPTRKALALRKWNC